MRNWKQIAKSLQNKMIQLIIEYNKILNSINLKDTLFQKLKEISLVTENYNFKLESLTAINYEFLKESMDKVLDKIEENHSFLINRIMEYCKEFFKINKEFK